MTLDTTSSTPADFINRLLLSRLHRKLAEAFEKRIQTSISLLLAKPKDDVSVDSLADLPWRFH